MTAQRRAAWLWGVALLGAALVVAVLHVVPGTGATTDQPSYYGTGSITVTTQAGLVSADQNADSAVSGGSASGGGSHLGPTESLSTVAGPPGTPTDDSHWGGDPDGDHRFGITVAPVSGLYPGKRSRLQIVFHNPQPVAISVRTATITATGPADCPLDASLILRTRHFIHKVVVPAHGSKAKSLRFGMRKTATDGCQNAVFTLTVTASAVRA